MEPQRLDLRYSIVWRSPWHVGSGFRSAATDRMLQRMGGRRGTPYLSGAQIKGVVRHTCERLAQTLGLDALDPHARTTDQQQALVPTFAPLRETPLVVDRLFGSRYQGDCLFVDNALPTSAFPSTEGRPLGSIVRARTAMDRVTGTVKEQHLFTTELAGPEIILQGAMRARHPAGVLTQDDGGFPYEYALLVAGLLTIEAFGGDKSAGLGACSVTVEDIRWNSQAVTVEAALASFAEADWAVMLQLIREANGK